MIPYIIINGRSSKDVNGLIIQTLPPISKPLLRTEVEEIDGRDGDIITPLGFAAYDKPITVGLRGDYDVNDAIEFFNSAGEIIFSNELDKIYNFAIYDAADFNKLVRFRTATINIHVQPFKHSADDPVISWEGTEDAFIPVRNKGNYYSRPLITITGSNDINMYINDVKVLSLTLAAAGETIIIDAEKMNAYSTDGSYLNRKVTGDYDDVRFLPEINNLYITGSVTSVTVKKYSRWI